jgi:hypothetical protein
MTNIRLHYLHRDAGNWKDYLDAVLSNPNDLSLEEAEREVRKRLIDGDYFYAGKAGLPESVYTELGDWHEFDRLEPADDDTEISMSVDEFLRRLEKARPRPIKVRKIPKGVPIRLAISWLEFLRETRQSLDLVLAGLRKDSIVIAWPPDDWELLEETLEMDANSSHFDRNLRRDIANALDHGRQLPDPVASIRPILRKCAQIEGQIQRLIKRRDV